jgi:hypothetical protein
MFWLPGGLCGAESIEVSGRTARTPDATECATFVARANLGAAVGAVDRMDLLGALRQAVSPGQRLNPAVRCVVEPCSFWARGDRCAAHAILIHGPHASTVAATDCATFERRQG